jgi:hypothetical protein
MPGSVACDGALPVTMPDEVRGTTGGAPEAGLAGPTTCGPQWPAPLVSKGAQLARPPGI